MTKLAFSKRYKHEERYWVSFLIKEPGKFTSKLSSHYRDLGEVQTKLQELKEQYPNATITLSYDER